MSLGSAIAIYLLIWVVTLFMVLPIGVRTHEEAGEDRVKGQADSAPARPNLGKKLIWNTLLAGVLFGLVWLNSRIGWITADDFPQF